MARHNYKNKGVAEEFKDQMLILLGLTAVLWLIEIIDYFILQNYSLNRYGIVPRDLIGLRGILFAPFLHGNFPHLIANTIPFVSLGWLVMLQRTSDFWRVTALTMLVGGFGVWTLGRPDSVHIGASILIFGYLGFLLFRGYFQRNAPSIALSIIVGIFYGSLIFGVLPLRSGVSWEGHLFGFIGGIIAAYQVAKSAR
ncbi:rhomboid family intramembrane serine protease [Euhalothece natronophila Z-M001]|uniref:Rhomboid family intramembrane serine protease n=1 Tax=Euhalothece natronophila Z-M001 TaxID=522448 RepID=A0A5B8NNJ2_9CHRO|nr:rhomboid family intramembrane serine protease [Euhalothece natronophila]QDZ40822.1 rhomboid family intramembrane serine protease [Euhalothece natronophila Z-M001]